MSTWGVGIAVAGGLVALWLASILALWWVARRDAGAVDLRDMLRLVPDLVRLLHRLAGDPEVPGRTRLALGLLVVYLASPIDLVPDFLPVIGYVDDIVIVALTLRAVVRSAGPRALERHWPGTPEGLGAVMLLVDRGNRAR